MLVPFQLDQDIEDLILGIDGAPQVNRAAIDLEIDFILVPAHVWLGSVFTQVRCNQWPKWLTQRRGRRQRACHKGTRGQSPPSSAG